jgi:hypothetical protein
MAQHIADRIKDAAGYRVTLIDAKSYTNIPRDCSWVVCMNAGPQGSTIISDARARGIPFTSIPPAWAPANEKLTKRGFYVVSTRPMDEPAPGKQRPFADLAEAMARRKEEEKAFAEQKIREAQERAEAQRKAAEAAEAAEVAEQERVIESTQEEVDKPFIEGAPNPEPPVAVVPPPLAETEPDRFAKRLATLREKRGQKVALLWDVFDKNPNLSLPDANAILIALGPDGRGINADEITDIRSEVRALKGLPPIQRARSRLARAIGVAPIYEGTEPIYTPALAEVRAEVPAEEPVAPTPECPTCHSTDGMRWTGQKWVCHKAHVLDTRAFSATARMPAAAPGAMPPDVESAARLLKEALLAATDTVASFTLTYQSGKVRVSWLPIARSLDMDL